MIDVFYLRYFVKTQVRNCLEIKHSTLRMIMTHLI